MWLLAGPAIVQNGAKSKSILIPVPSPPVRPQPEAEQEIGEESCTRARGPGGWNLWFSARQVLSALHTNLKTADNPEVFDVFSLLCPKTSCIGNTRSAGSGAGNGRLHGQPVKNRRRCSASGRRVTKIDDSNLLENGEAAWHHHRVQLTPSPKSISLSPARLPADCRRKTV